MVPQLSPISQRLGDIMVLVNDDWKQMVTQKQQVYCSYLLRLWREGHSSQSPWRASLESAQTGKIYRFAGLEELFVFLVVPKVGDAGPHYSRTAAAIGNRDFELKRLSWFELVLNLCRRERERLRQRLVRCRSQQDYKQEFLKHIGLCCIHGTVST